MHTDGRTAQLPPAATATAHHSDSLAIVPTHVLQLPVAAPVAILYLPFSRLAASHSSPKQSPLTAGGLYQLDVVHSPVLASHGDVGDGASSAAASSHYLVCLQPLLPFHRQYLHPARWRSC